MKTKIKKLKSALPVFIIVCVVATSIISVRASKRAGIITISNEHLYKKNTPAGSTVYKYVMDISFPNPSDIRNPLNGTIIKGTYSIKLNRIDGKRTSMSAYIAMDYKDIGDALFVQATIFNSDGSKPLATSRSISIKDAEPE